MCLRHSIAYFEMLGQVSPVPSPLTLIIRRLGEWCEVSSLDCISLALTTLFRLRTAASLAG